MKKKVFNDETMMELTELRDFILIIYHSGDI